MNSITDDKIFDLLSDAYAGCAEKYGEGYTICAYAYGECNYGFADSIQEIMIESIFVPTFEQMCCNVKADTISYMVNGHFFTAKDIRLAFNSVKNGDVTICHSLFTKYIIMNPKYEGIFQRYFVKNRDIIFNGTRGYRIVAAAQKGLECIERYKEFPLPYYLYKAKHWLNSCKKYNQGMDFWECVQPINEEEEKDLRHFKTARFFPDNEFNQYEYLKNLSEDLTKYINIGEHKVKIDISKETEELKMAVVEMIKIAHNSNSHLLSFIKELTDSEKIALKTIINEVGAEGYVSILKLSEEAGVSRPVFANLISKMKSAEIAIIQNKGAKGTYIKILKEELLNF